MNKKILESKAEKFIEKGYFTKSSAMGKTESQVEEMAGIIKSYKEMHDEEENDSSI